MTRRSTWGAAKKSGDDYRIEKAGGSIGWAKKRGSKWSIETFAGSTLGWLNGKSIEKTNGATWTSLDAAKKLVAGDDPIAEALWVLKETGKF